MLYIRIQDILTADADILVLSANPSLLAGSGISGVIHKAAGPQLEATAKPFSPLEPGQAIITPGFNLPAKYIIHAVCPRYIDGQRGESEQLYNAYASALALHNQAPKAKSIAFVSMGTGVYKWPMELAAGIAVTALLKSTFDLTVMCVRDETARVLYQKKKNLYNGVYNLES
ncbi:macro domain-containing protein [Porticoccaceae bacterium]|jgi:O-acetyl-ADP-ribose deacetylase (regulator of RNase III)|nr:macro domain-containing protein [Porticoccaceae bacterium]